MDRSDPNNTICVIDKVFREYIDSANYLTSKDSYKSASLKLERIDFAQDDVTTFAGLINRKRFTDKANYWTAGLFISAAINKVITKNGTMTLAFSDMDHPVDCIGYALKQGTIALQGNAGDYLGEEMSGGKIIIQGNAGNYVGYAMSGGEIIIQGNAESNVGRYMSGGMIKIEGKIDSISESCGGKIYCEKTLL